MVRTCGFVLGLGVNLLAPVSAQLQLGVSSGEDCNCGGWSSGQHLFPGETVHTCSDESKCAGCIGGCSGNDFTFHREGESVAELECWGYGGDNDGFTSLRVKYTNGEESYIGSPQKESVKFKFDPKETFVGDIEISGNGIGTRPGYLGFTMGRPDGSTRKFSCGHSGASKHWHFPADGLTLAGFFGRGSDEVDQLGFILKEQDCPVEKREIIGVKCKSKEGPGGLCEAAFSEDVAGAQLTTPCDFCGTGSPGKCEGNFQYTRVREITTSSTDIDSLGGSVEISNTFKEDFFFAKAEQSITVGVTYEHTWEKSKSQADTETMTIESACESSPKPHTRTDLEMTVVVGTMTGDIELTMRTKRTCEAKAKETTHDGTVTIKNVPLISLSSNCKVIDVPCSQSMIV